MIAYGHLTDGLLDQVHRVFASQSCLPLTVGSQVFPSTGRFRQFVPWDPQRCHITATLPAANLRVPDDILTVGDHGNTRPKAGIRQVLNDDMPLFWRNLRIVDHGELSTGDLKSKSIIGPCAGFIANGEQGHIKNLAVKESIEWPIP